MAYGREGIRPADEICHDEIHDGGVPGVTRSTPERTHLVNEVAATMTVAAAASPHDNALDKMPPISGCA